MINAKDPPRPEDQYRIERALLSVYDKTGLVPFAERLNRHGVSLLSTGGTARVLRKAGLEVIDVEEVTGFPEMLDGRVKTLHPHVHGAILSRRSDPNDMRELERRSINPIDLVVTNLYPFEDVVATEGVRESEAVENIDVGGPSMVRAAAKNFYFVGVVTSPGQYDAVADEIDASGGMLKLDTRRRLAAHAFRRTAEYDAAIARYFAAATSTEPASASGSPASAVENELLPPTLNLRLPRAASLRYGENPHQQAALYGSTDHFYEKLHGKDLSFNNLIDLSAALQLIDEFSVDAPTCAILKHTNPCGVAQADSLAVAYRNAFATDRQSPFGGIVVVNRPIDRLTAEAIDEIFTEIIIAPAFEDGVLDLLKQKKNRRIIRSLVPAREDRSADIRSVTGGLLVQHRDAALPSAPSMRDNMQVVTQREPTDEEWSDLDFAWRIVKHVKSNGIVYARGRRTLGIGAGQMSRIDASEIAVMKGRKSELDFTNSVVASDAFFPFADGLVAAAQTGARAAVQPGGSIRDEEVVEAANEHGMAMVFTGRRHFRH